ncbi:MAG TPA: thiamine pyrophosphate-dependent enzyme, partial [Virgibacillus sp.]|nr:thiamine pyrophosphate-dependent enzyme [Virgibacillus sp.]
GSDIEGPQFAQVAEAMGAVGITVDKVEDLPAAYQKALDAKKPVVMDIMVDGTMLAPPFRKDALKMPTRYLDKYKHLDYEEWK